MPPPASARAFTLETAFGARARRILEALGPAVIPAGRLVPAVERATYERLVGRVLAAAA
ncbi:MAG: hypothetical protein IPK07_30225 [Deltaproteobacteria bacterium]|nr:hypothetical protein [Deltaproteobacteria bacterium]